MKHQRGFALFDVLLAVVLMAIAAAGSYTLVKSFRSNSVTQQLIRYATNITQSFIPFLDGNSSSTVLDSGTHKLSADFLKAISISSADQVSCEAINSINYCNVDTGMYVELKKSYMSFGSLTGQAQTLASEFAIAVQASGTQVNQVLQSAASLFSVYCAAGGTVNLNTLSENCALLSKDESDTTYSLFLVFPKSEGAPPLINLTPPGLV